MAYRWCLALAKDRNVDKAPEVAMASLWFLLFLGDCLSLWPFYFFFFFFFFPGICFVGFMFFHLLLTFFPFLSLLAHMCLARVETTNQISSKILVSYLQHAMGVNATWLSGLFAMCVAWNDCLLQFVIDVGIVLFLFQTLHPKILTQNCSYECCTII